MMKKNKMTEREFLSTVTANLHIENEELHTRVLEYIANRLGKMDERNTNRKPTKKQQANEVLRKALLEAMEPNMVYTTTDLTKLDIFKDEPVSVPKVSALIKPLIKLVNDESDTEHPVIRGIVKGKVIYYKA